MQEKSALQDEPNQGFNLAAWSGVLYMKLGHHTTHIKNKRFSHLKYSVGFFKDNFFVSSQVHNTVWSSTWIQT